MARYRLKSAHYIEGDKYLPGDTENEAQGPEKGTIVGDGTPHVIKWPTLEMEPLDEEAEKIIEKERERLTKNDAVMNPIEKLDLENAWEANYVPGLNIRRREPKPDGAPVK